MNIEEQIKEILEIIELDDDTGVIKAVEELTNLIQAEKEQYLVSFIHWVNRIGNDHNFIEQFKKESV